MKYDITFSCGHEGTVELIGSGRERKLAYFRTQGLCPACFKAEREAMKRRQEAERAEISKAAAEAAGSLGWPELTGSEKQVAWATTLRREFYEWYIDPGFGKPDLEALDLIISGTTMAKDWIDNRDYWYDFSKKRIKYLTSREAQSEAEARSKETSIAAPEKQTKSGCAKIVCTGDTIYVSYPKDNDFMDIMHALSFKWDSGRREYKRKTDFMTGSVHDRAAELGNRLLRAGFAVAISSDEIRRAAITGEFEPECKRWFSKRVNEKYKGDIALSFSWGDEKMYKAGRSIAESYWDSPYVMIPVSHYQEILDVAEHMGCKLSDGAKQMIAEYKASIEICVPETPVKAEPTEKDVAEILKSDREVIPDLVDEP